MLKICQVDRTAAAGELAAIHHFGIRCFPRSLLLLGDLTEPLLGQTDIWVAWQTELVGVAVVFHGFATTLVSVVADDSESGMALMEELRPALKSPCLLVASLEEPLLSCFEQGTVDEDLWLIRETTPIESNLSTCAIRSASEIAAFYYKCGMHFWNPAMVDFGHYFGIRKPDSTLASIAGVNFVLSEPRYAQIGNVATDSEWQNKGFATSCVGAVIDSLHTAGVSRCGLFVDANRSDLIRLYERIGFQQAGRFRFVQLAI